MYNKIKGLILVLAITVLVTGTAWAQTDLRFDLGAPDDGAMPRMPAFLATNYNYIGWRLPDPLAVPTLEFVDQQVEDAIDFNTGSTTGIALTLTSEALDFGGATITAGFNEVGPNTSGTATPSGAAAIFDGTATLQNLFGHSLSNFNVGALRPEAEFTITGLDSSKLYDFTFFASRSPSGENRETQYDVTGANSGSDALDPANNTSNVASVTGIQPTGGTLTLNIIPGPNNNHPDGFFYLGAMRILENGAAPGQAGDYNNNGVVDAADYAVWLDNLGAAAGALPNDTDGGAIGQAQYNTWKTNFGAGSATAAGGSNAIPEPASALLLLLGLLACSRISRSSNGS